MKTWAAQKDYEWQIRKSWLEEVAAQDISIQAMADSIGMERGQFHKMCSNFGVEVLTIKRKQAKSEAKRQSDIARNAAARKAERQKQKIMEQTRESAARELQRRKSLLMAEGWSEQQALRALAHQLGVTTLEAAQ